MLNVIYKIKKYYFPSTISDFIVSALCVNRITPLYAVQNNPRNLIIGMSFKATIASYISESFKILLLVVFFNLHTFFY